MSDDSALILEDDGPVRHIRFNRPERLNAIDLEQHDRVIRALRAADADPAVRVIAFSGEGRAFCAGDDLKAGGESALPDRYDGRRVDLDVGLGPLLLQETTTVIRNLGTPTVVLMHGYTLGAGYDYATSCDVRIATESVIFGDPRVHRAMWCAEGWSYKLTRLVPQAYAAQVSYLGEQLTGREAYEIGLVHRVYPDDVDLRESAAPFLHQLAELDPEAFRWTKLKMLADLDLSFEASLDQMPRLDRQPRRELV